MASMLLHWIPAKVVMGLVTLRSLVLFARMRTLRRIVDMIVRTYTIVARQRVVDAWSPPERTALNGRRNLNSESLNSGALTGLLLGRRL